jgi:amino acid adenylation domain-containing protein
VLDRHLQPVPVGVPGQLFVGGVQLTPGYWHRPDLTAEHFIPHPFRAEPGARLYRTGDLVRWLPDGNIDFLGRIDNQVKIRGFRIELGEIEATLDRHPAVRQSLVIVREDAPDRTQLVAYVQPEPGAVPAVHELRAHLKESLPAVMVPSAVVLLEAFPLTPHGKVDRRALPVPSCEHVQTAGEFVRPQTEMERALAAVWQDLLKVDHIGLTDNIFDLGGHSLLAIKAVSRIRDVFAVDLPTRTLFASPTIAEMTKAITAARDAGGIVQRIGPRRQPGPCALSFAQERFWLAHQVAPASPVYNIADVLSFDGTCDINALRRALTALTGRHEVLRTRIDIADGRPVQTVLPTVDLALTELDLSALTEPDREREWARVVREEGRKPFNLSCAPLMRATVAHLGARRHELLLTSHHIVADEWAMEVIHQEVAQLYDAFAQGRPCVLPALPIQYADFACWQRDRLQGGVLQAEIAYWKEELAGAPFVLDLPTDKPRPASQSFRGATETFAVPGEVLQRLTALGRQERATLFMLLAASFMAMLHRYTSQADILVGTPISGRTRSEFERLVGCFINTVVLRGRFDEALTFRGLLQQMRERALGAYAHPDLPFERLVTELAPPRDPGRAPLVQAMVVLHDAEGESDASTVSGNQQLATGTSKFDLTLVVSETDEGLDGLIEYSTDLFDAPTIQRLCGHYGVLLDAMAHSPDASIATLPMLTETERHQVVEAWNQTAVAYPPPRCVHEMVEEQARIRPEALAVESASRQLSYRELDERAEWLARRLQGHGVGTDAPVAVYLDRGLEMLVALLATWKAGAAYVPIDPEYPADRIRFMLKDLDAAVVVTQPSLSGALPATNAAIINLDVEEQDAAAPADRRARPVTSPDQLAYVIYTSGSTGRPKGVPITHASLCNLINWHQQAYALGPDDRATQIAGPAFDASVWEIWPYLTAGASVHIPDPATRLDAGHLVQWIADQRITLAFLPTPLAESVLREPWPAAAALRVLLTGGDRLKQRPARSLPFRVVNHYGPTENTVVSTCADVTDDADPVPPIGRPLPNTQAYVLDRHLQPVRASCSWAACN